MCCGNFLQKVKMLVSVMGWIIYGSYVNASSVYEVSKYTVVSDMYLVCACDRTSKKILVQLLTCDYENFINRIRSTDTEQIPTEQAYWGKCWDSFCDEKELHESDQIDIASVLKVSGEYCLFSIASVGYVSGNLSALDGFKSVSSGVVIDISGTKRISFPGWEVYANEINKQL